jgi:hypothetical protein
MEMRAGSALRARGTGRAMSAVCANRANRAVRAMGAGGAKGLQAGFRKMLTGWNWLRSLGLSRQVIDHQVLDFECHSLLLRNLKRGLEAGAGTGIMVRISKNGDGAVLSGSLLRGSNSMRSGTFCQFAVVRRNTVRQLVAQGGIETGPSPHGDAAHTVKSIFTPHDPTHRRWKALRPQDPL